MPRRPRGFGKRVRFSDASHPAPTAPCSEDVTPPEGEAPDVPISLRSMQGDVFQVEASVLWRHSPVVRHLVQDNGADDEVPLPGLGSHALKLLLDFCAQNQCLGMRHLASALPNDVDVPTSLELLWAARLLGMDRLKNAAFTVLAGLLEGGECGAPPFLSIPVETLRTLLRDHWTSLSLGRLCDIVTAVAAGAGRADDKNAVKALAVHLAHQSDQVRHAAQIGLQAVGTVDAWCALLTCPKSAVRAVATRSLPRNWPEMTLAASRVLNNRSLEFRESMVHAIAATAPRGDVCAVAALAEALEDPVREVREAAVSAFRTVAVPDDEQTVAAVIRSTVHPDALVRSCALRALVLVAPGCPALVEEIATTLLQEKSATMVKHVASGVLKSMQTSATLDEVGDADSRFALRLGMRDPASRTGCDWAEESSEPE